MKILYVVHKYDYGKPELGFAYEHYNFYATLVRMQGDKNVVYFPVDEVRRKEGEKGLNEGLLKVVYEEKPDFVFFFYTGTDIKKETIKEITQKSGAITFNWFYDDQWRFENYTRYFAPYFHWVATTDPLSVEKYHKIGYKNAFFLAQGYNQYFYKPLNLPKIYDVTFIGRPHGIRKKMIKKLEEAGINVKCFGEGWPTGYISYEEVIKVISQSKINLNFSESSGVFWKQLALLFLHRNDDRSIGLNNPRQLIDNLKTFLPSMKSKQIKGRIFEVAGCGAFLLTGYAPHLEDLYSIGKEIEGFNNFKELVEKIKYYLKHDEERKAIARAGYERTLKSHTYEKRFNEIFKIIGLAK
ncbi:MAG: hypothetical protein C0412_14870 [Flavobacterium sp.]|nr:hypothetical protein [Flavobacterium sp.]